MIPYILLETVEVVVGNFAVLIITLLVGNPVLVGIFCFMMLIASILPIYFILVLRSHYYEVKSFKLIEFYIFYFINAKQSVIGVEFNDEGKNFIKWSNFVWDLISEVESVYEFPNNFN